MVPQTLLLWVGALGAIAALVPVAAIISSSRRRTAALDRANRTMLTLLAERDLADERRTVLEQDLAHSITSTLARQESIIRKLREPILAGDLMGTNLRMREGMRMVLEVLAATERIPEDRFEASDLARLARLTALNWEAASRPNRPAVLVSACEHPIVRVPTFEARRAICRAMDYIVAVMSPSCLILTVCVEDGEAVLDVSGDSLEMADDTTASSAGTWAFVAQRLTLSMGGRMDMAGSKVRVRLPLHGVEEVQPPPLDLTRRITKLQAQFG